MSLINNQYYSIPKEVWWYSQTWFYASKHKLINGKIYIYVLTNNTYRSCYVPFTIDTHIIEIIKSTV